MMEAVIVLVCLGLIALVLSTPLRGFVFGLGAIASLFAMIASIIHFHILGAIGFLILTVILGNIASI